MKIENNNVILSGEITSDFRFSHEVFGEKFYLFDLKVNRFSENFDILPILVSERLVNVKQSALGATARIEGQLRSYSKRVGEKSHTIISVFVNEIENIDGSDFSENLVEIQGFVCKEPIYRKTPLGKDIADFWLAVNRPYGKSDYIPCIAWGRDAIFMGSQEVGTEIKVTGRFQSREYSKRIGEDLFETRTAYELSVQKLEVVNNECED